MPIVDDNEIIGFDTMAKAEFILHPNHKVRAFVEVTEKALKFWTSAQTAILADEWPDWIFSESNKI